MRARAVRGVSIRGTDTLALLGVVALAMTMVFACGDSGAPATAADAGDDRVIPPGDDASPRVDGGGVDAGPLAPMVFVLPAPVRLFDSNGKGPTPKGTSVGVPVAGVASIPRTGVSAVLLGVAASNATTSGAITVFPSGVTQPAVPSLVYAKGRTVSNVAFVGVGVDGSVSTVDDQGGSALTIDAVGFIATAEGSAYIAASPWRLFDSRLSASIGPQGSVDLAVAGKGGVVAGATGALFNVTVIAPGASGGVRVFAKGGALPSLASLSYAGGEISTGLVAAPIGAGGALTLANDTGTIDIVVDVEGWLAPPSSTANGGALSALTPTRLADAMPLAANTSIELPVIGVAGVPSRGVSSVAIDLTVKNAPASGFFTVYPGGEGVPLASHLDFTAGQTFEKLVWAKVSPAGTIAIHNDSGAASAVSVDIVGYASAPGYVEAPLFLDGFFPLAADYQPSTTFDAWKARGVNTVIRVPAPAPNYGNDTVDTWTAAANARGLKMIRAPRANASDDVAEAGLLAWSGPDEPEGNHGAAAAGLVANAITLRAVDPKRPQMINFIGPYMLAPNGVCNGPGDGADEGCYPSFFPALDWIADDIYPRLGGAPLAVVGQTLVRMTARARPRPAFQYIEASAISGGRNPSAVAPTAGEFRAEVWDAIIHGARGVFYFPHTGCDPCQFPDGTTPEIQAEMLAQNTRIAGLGPVLQSAIEPMAIAMHTTAPLEATWRQTSTASYFFVLNFSPSATTKASMKVDGVALSSVPVEGESRTVTPFDASTLADDFAPYEVHVYRVP